MYLCDKCDREAKSECNLPCYYGQKDKFENSQVTWTAMTGNPKGNKFKVLEYEVYEVIYE